MEYMDYNIWDLNYGIHGLYYMGLKLMEYMDYTIWDLNYGIYGLYYMGPELWNTWTILYGT